MAKYRKNFVQCMCYLHKRQFEMLANVHGKNASSKKGLYRVFANHIVDCIYNLINYPKESVDVIDKDLDYLSKLSYLETCITSTRSLKTRILLLVLKKWGRRQRRAFFTIYFNIRKQLGKIKRCLRK